MAHHGRCACGDVRYSVDGALRDVVNCHCHRCRRVTGHYLAATSADATRLHVDGEPRWWTEDGTAEYAFCGTCGSTLFWRATAAPERVSIAAGTLDVPSGLRTTQAWWCVDASDYYDHPSGLELVEYEG